MNSMNIGACPLLNCQLSQILSSQAPRVAPQIRFFGCAALAVLEL
jgi:hypothetical protein